MRIIDLFILGADIQSTITMLHPVTSAARLWCSTQAIGVWANDVLTVASVEHLTAIINAIPDGFETITM